MNVEPIAPAFEAEIARLAGKRRKGESVEDHLRRINRVRLGLRELWATRRDEEVRPA